MTLTIVFAETSLERVPRKIANHPVVAGDAEKRRKLPHEILLDSNKHWRAMQALENKEKRGRPDIAHDLVKACLDSPLNKQGKLAFFMHTLDGRVITINPETRIPRSYNQFVGLIEKLYKDGAIKAEGKMLLKIEEKTLEALLKDVDKEFVVLDPLAKQTKLKPLVQEMKGDYACVVGGFPHGDFINAEVLKPFKHLSIAKEELTAPAVLSLVLACYALANE